MAQSAKKRKQLEKLLGAANILPDSTPGIEDDLLLAAKGIGPAVLRDIRAFWPPQNGDAEPTPAPREKAVPVYDFGLRTSGEKEKRGGIWHDFSALYPERWGPVHLRLRSPSSAAVMAATDRAEAALIAGQPGSEVLLGKVREEVKADTGDRLLSQAIVAAAFSLLKRHTKQQDLELSWRKGLACIRGMRGSASFDGEVREFTGREPAEKIQALLAPILEMSDAHAADVLRSSLEIRALDDAEILRLGEGYVVTERPVGALSSSVAKTLAAGR